MITMSMLLVGVLLGFLVNIYGFLPALFFGAVIALGVGFARGDDPWSFVLVVAAVLSALQIGYISGAAIYFGILRRRKKSPGHLATAQERSFESIR